MKAIILVDIPEDESLDVLHPFNTKVTLDYGDKVIELNGEVRKAPDIQIYSGKVDDYEEGYNSGYNDCVHEIAL